MSYRSSPVLGAPFLFATVSSAANHVRVAAAGWWCGGYVGWWRAVWMEHEKL